MISERATPLRCLCIKILDTPVMAIISLILIKSLGFIFHTLISVIITTLESIDFKSLIAKATDLNTSPWQKLVNQYRWHFPKSKRELLTRNKHETYLLVEVLLLTRLKYLMSKA